MAKVGTFPLLKLPYLPLANVIQQFDSIHKRVDFATLSKQTAILVESLRDIKVLGLELVVSESLKLSVIQLTDGRFQELAWTYGANPNTPDFPFLVDNNRLRKLIDTLLFIFGLSGFAKLAVYWQEDRALEVSRFQNLLRNLNTIEFERIYSNGFYRQVLAAFPSVRNVIIRGEPGNQLLTKNLDIVKLSPPSLYGLEMVNCESLQLTFFSLMEAELNGYLKNWIQGKLPRLKHIRIQSAFLRQDLVFKRIEIAEADRNRKMTFKSYSSNLGDPKTTVVQGGVDIKSENGARATITIQEQNERNRFVVWNMNVWD